MNKHAKVLMGKKMIDIDSLTTSELNAAIKKYGKMANTRLTKLRSSGMMEFSNTMERIHKQRLEKSYVGTKSGDFRVNVSGSKTEKQDRLQYMLAFLIDPQTNEKAVKEYVKDDIHYLFGDDVKLSTKKQLQPYLDTLRTIYDTYRSLGIEYGYGDSATILQNVASIIQDSSTHKLGRYNIPPEELTTQLQNFREDAAKLKYTEDDIREFLASYGTEYKIDGKAYKNVNLLKLLTGELSMVENQGNGITFRSPGGITK